jgi:phage baseplate assembly protein W
MNGESHQRNEFLGTGIAFPLSVTDDGLIAMNALEDHVRQSILLILQTARGERVMRPDFGCDLDELVFEPLRQATYTLAEHHVKQALIRFEPRIEVLGVQVAASPQQQDDLLIHLRYRVRSTDTTFNLVYPFYVERGGL